MRHRLLPAEIVPNRRSGEVAAPNATPAQISSATAKSSRYATANNPFPVAHILREQRRRDLFAAVESSAAPHGPERVWWRRDARHRLAEWRRLHQEPERGSLQAAVMGQVSSAMNIDQADTTGYAPRDCRYSAVRHRRLRRRPRQPDPLPRYGYGATARRPLSPTCWRCSRTTSASIPTGCARGAPLNITIERGTCWVDSDAVLGWIAVNQGLPDGPKGQGDCPTEALQDLLLQLRERGHRGTALIDMLDAESPPSTGTRIEAERNGSIA